jgi:hypothetical protein
MMSLQEYDFDVYYKKGELHMNADAISRLLDKVTPELNLTFVEGIDIESLGRKQREDKFCSMIISYLEDGVLPQKEKDMIFIERNINKFKVDDESNILLYKRKINNTRKQCIVLPITLKQQIMNELHDGKTAGHYGINGTYNKVKERFYFKGMYKFVEDWVKTCDLCQSKKTPKNLTTPLQPITTSHFGEQWAVDIMTDLPTTQRGNCLIVFIEYFSKWIEVIPARNHRAHTIAQAFVDQVVCRHGMPKTILSDQGKEFESKFIQALCSTLNIKKISSAPYYHKTNGQVERANKEIVEKLRNYSHERPGEWDDYTNDCLQHPSKHKFNPWICPF